MSAPSIPRIGVFFSGHKKDYFKHMERIASELEPPVQLLTLRYESVRMQTSDDGAKITIAGTFEPDDFDVFFFRLVGKHLEEVDLLVNGIRARPEIAIVDPLLQCGPPSRSRKAYQMVALRQRGIPVPDSLYAPLAVLEREAEERFGFPCIIKGSHGDRGNAVWLVQSAAELRRLVRDTLLPSESSASKKSARKFMAQEFIPNDGDYRILVLGNRALGAMKRSAASTTPDEFRNNISCGGQGSVATDLPEEVLALAVRAAEQCHVAVAGVDIVLRDGDPTRPVVFEVNSGPQFAGFQAATGIDVPAEIVKFLAARAYEVRGITLAKAPDAAPTPPCSFCHAPYAVSRMRSSDGRVVGDACAHCRRRLLPADTYRRPGEAEDVELDHRLAAAPVVGGRRRQHHHRSRTHSTTHHHGAAVAAADAGTDADSSSACRVQ